MFRYILLILCLIGCSSQAPIECHNETCEDSMNAPIGMNTSGWSASGKITPGSGGGVDSFSPGKGTQVSLQPAPFPETGNYTVQFAVNDPNTVGLNGGTVVRLRAEITWFVNGNQIRRVVDVADGTSVSGCAEKVNITVFDASTLVGQTLKDVDVAISVSKGTRSSVQQPPRLYILNGTLNPGAGQVIVQIPKNIGAISVFVAMAPLIIGTAVNAYDILIHQETISTQLMVYDARQTDWVPLAPGVSEIRIEGSAANPGINMQVILGIDG